MADAVTWTDERIARAVELWNEGRSASQISRELGGVSRAAVVSKLNRIGLTAREQPTEPTVSRSGALRAPAVKRAVSQNNGLNAQRRKRGAQPVSAEAVVNGPAQRDPGSREPHVVISSAVWAPLAGSSPRPWAERGLGCKWPVDVPGSEVQHACCNTRKPGHRNYCPEHHDMSVSRQNAVAPRGAALIRSLRRVA